MSEKSQKTGKKIIWVCKSKPLSFYISRTQCKNTVMKADPRPVFGPFDGGCWLSHWAAWQPNFLHPRCGHRSSERQDFSRSWVRQIKSHVLIYWRTRLIYYFCFYCDRIWSEVGGRERGGRRRERSASWDSNSGLPKRNCTLCRHTTYEANQANLDGHIWPLRSTLLQSFMHDTTLL